MKRPTRRTALVSFLVGVALVAASVFGVHAIAFAQEDGERSRLVRFVERQISTPNRQIRLGAIEGALSSDVRLASITIADRDGVWLTIRNARLVWSRGALLRGRLDVDLLEAESIVVSRAPLPDQDAGDDEPIDDTPFAIPELPVALELDRLNVPSVDIAQGVIGPAIEMAVDGKIILADGTLDLDVGIERQDRPGTLSLVAGFSNRTRDLALDIVLSEPADGVVANALNIAGRPPIEFEIKGEGPLDNYSADIRLAADGEDLVTGRTTIAAVADGLRYQLGLDGDLGRLVPATYADLVDTGSRATVDLTRKTDGAIDIAAANLSSGALALTFSGAFAPDGVPTAIDLDARIGRADGDPIELPGGGGDARIDSGRLIVTLGGPIGQRWNASFLMENLVTPTVSAARATLNGGGEAVNLAEPDQRRITFDVSGGTSAMTSDNPDIARALGETLTIEAAGSWNAGEPVAIDRAALAASATSANFSGSVGTSGLIGDFMLAASDLAAFSGIADRALGGSVDLTASGSVTPGAGLFDFTVDGRTEDLAVGIDAVDGLLAGTTTLSGSASRTTGGFVFDEFAILSPEASIRIDGQTTGAEVDLTALARIGDLALVNPRASGVARLETRLAGPNGRPNVTARLTGEDLVLAGETLSDADARLDGAITDGTFEGTFALSGLLRNEAIRASGGITAGGEARLALRDLDARVGGATLTGSLDETEDGPFAGSIALDVPELADLAPILLTELSGTLAANIVLSATGDRQDATVAARTRALQAPGARIGFADIDLDVAGATDIPVISGRVSARDVEAGGVRARSVDLTATPSDDGTGTPSGGTAFDLAADLATARIAAAGSLTPAGRSGFEIALSTFTLAGEALTLALDRPAALEVEGGTVSVEDLSVTAGGGRLSLSGSVGDTLDLSGELQRFPLAVANLVKPDLAAGGTLSGTLATGGTANAPTATFSLDATDVSLAAIADAGLPPVDATLAGRLDDDLVTLDRAAVTVGGGRIVASGTAGRTFDLSVSIETLPLALANAFAPDLALSGALSGRAQVTGSQAAPEATFEIAVPALSAGPLQTAGIGSVAVATSGSLARNTVSLSRLTVTGSGLDVAASGTIPLTGSGLDLRIEATAPLGLGNRFLAAQGATISGNASASIAVTGSLASPRVTGEARASGIRFVDGGSGLVLADGTLLARFDGERIVIETLTARLGDGTVSVTGSIAINPGAGFPADLSIALRSARYTSGELIAITLSGDLDLVGPLTTGPRLSGTINIDRAEINIASNFPGGPTLIEVAHINAPRDVLETLRRARIGPYAPRDDSGGGTAFDLGLDVTINAPRRIFVRGRGIDAELGGSIRILGSSSSIVPVGAFNLIRGRIEILTRRIVFSRGAITLQGDLDPAIDFLAETTGGSIRVQVAVTGRVSDPQIVLTSTPELPQDEILAQLLFGRSIDELSGFQLAQLAASAASLAGGGGASPLDQIRQLTGLDDLGVVTDDSGGVGVQAGRYIADNIYLGVQAGENDTNVTVNLDVTNNLKVRGAAGIQDSSIGFYFEREY